MRSLPFLVMLGVACSGPKGDSGVHEDCAEQTWYADLDGDGAFGSDGTVVSCEAPADYGAEPTDCDDTDPPRRRRLGRRPRPSPLRRGPGLR
jgi:hypothetical protein